MQHQLKVYFQRRTCVSCFRGWYLQDTKTDLSASGYGQLLISLRVVQVLL